MKLEKDGAPKCNHCYAKNAHCSYGTMRLSQSCTDNILSTQYMSSTLETKKIIGVSIEAKNDVHTLLELCYTLRSTASKKGSYDHLEDWTKPVYELHSRILHHYGFKNGDVEYNNSIPDIQYWWGIYGIINNIIYSPNLHTEYENHHSSAWERNEALIAELEFLISD
jgi:hypothetical protein